MIRFGRRLLLLALPLFVLQNPVIPRPAEAQSAISAPSALADSIAARAGEGRVVVASAADGVVTLPIGSDAGIRNWSVVTLGAGTTPPWRGKVRELAADRVVLGPDTSMVPVVPVPPAGEERSYLIDVRRVGLSPVRGEESDASMRLELGLRLEEELTGRKGVTVIRVGDFPDSLEGSEIASVAGADLLVTPRVEYRGDQSFSFAAKVRVVRKGTDWWVTVPPIPRRPFSYKLRPGEIRDPLNDNLPGVRSAFVSDWRRGPLLELFTRRWIWSDVQAVFDDRIETWHIAPDRLEPVTVHDLDPIWPRAVPTRWPVGAITPIRTFYSLNGGEEASVNYALCSNQREHYLTIEVEKAHPESLSIVVSKDEGDSLAASADGCFPKLDRVPRSKEFPLPPDFPATAVARVTLESIVRDAGGKVMRSDLGLPRTKKSAVVYYDAPGSAVWVSTATGCRRVDGRFGSEMEAFRPGQAGPAGVLLTGAGAPGEPDHLEWWALADDRLVRRWSSEPLQGVITALLGGDRDGDERDDLLVGEVVPDGNGWKSRVSFYSSRPSGGENP